MIFSCKYDSAGRILEWTKGSSLAATHHRSNLEASFGEVSKYPKELLTKPGQWKNCRVSKVNNNGSVEIELAS